MANNKKFTKKDDSKDVERNDKRDNRYPPKRGRNDFAWYNKHPNLVKDAGSLSFANMLGLEATRAFDSTRLQNAEVDTSFSLPGIMRIDTIPTFGVSEGPESMLNVCARNLYSDIRSSNSGAKVYEPADLMMYLMSMDNMYTLWAWVVRIYGLAMTYNGKNRYYPRALVQSMGVDFDDVISNLANFRANINMFAAKLSSVYVPTNMPLFQRHQWLYRNIYLDAPGDKAQTYFFNPTGFYRYVETEGPGYLEFNELHKFFDARDGLSAHLITTRHIIDTIQTEVDNLLKSEDIGIMSGDILKHFGIGNTFVVGAIPDTYSVVPTYSEEVNMQIHNLRSLGLHTLYNADEADSWNLTQDVPNQALIYTPKFTSTVGLTVDPIMDMYTSEASPEHVMVASRLIPHVIFEPMATSDDGVFSRYGSYLQLKSCGSEVVTGIFICNLHPNGTLVTNPIGTVLEIVSGTESAYPTTFYLNDEYETENPMDFLRYVSDFACFDWAPLLEVWGISDNNPLERGISELSFNGLINDLDNYTVLGMNTLDNLHNVALLSLLDIPTGSKK